MPVLEATTRTGGRVALETSATSKLRAGLRGRLLGPDEDGYDRARSVWNGMIDHRPALIARCTGVTDVVAAVTFAREHDLLLSVRCGGHNIAGKAVCDGGLMIDLSPMRGVYVDPVERTARVDGGATLGALDRATQESGLATTAGVVTHTGVGGLTLGGGVGRLARMHGLACDNVVSVELVTAEGAVVRASPNENTDLFWAVRGGGGNFGIVTSFEFRLHPVGPAVLGGIVVHPWAKAKAALRFHAEFSRTAPDELSTDAGCLTSPDGEPVLVFSVCYVGSIEEGERMLEPLRRFGPPLVDQIRAIPYTEVQSATDALFPTGLRYYWQSHFLDQISDDAVEATVGHFATAPSPRSVVIFQQYGGAVGRIARGETAFWHRDAEYDAFAASIWDDPLDAFDVHRQWVRDWWEMVQPTSLGGEYVNNLGDEGEDRVRAAYGENYARLVAVKETYDPANVFRLNANIRPRG
jgi:hypothetical protein